MLSMMRAGLVLLGISIAGCGAGTRGGFDFTAPATGREGASSGTAHEIEASTVVPTPWSGEPTGPGLDNSVSNDFDGRPATPVPISLGQTIRGRLETGDARLRSGAYADDYVFFANAGDEVTIELRGGNENGQPGSHLDVYLYLLHEGHELTRDDDGLGNLDSVISRRLERAGLYTLRASSFGGSPREGEYSIRVRAGLRE